jgi:hypothetical protein
MQTASTRFPPRGLLLLVGGITLAGLALRLPSFGDSLFGDEVSTYGIVSGHGPATVLDLVRSDLENTPPLFYLLAAAGERLGGAPEGLRLASLIAGVAAIPLTYWLGSLTVGRRPAAVGAALIALSPFLVYYSTEARSYSLAMTLCLLSTLALLKAAGGGGGGGGGGAPWWVAYAACSCAAMYTHYTAAFVLLAQFAWAFLAHPGARGPLLAANLAAAAAFLPWLPGLLEDADSPTYLYERTRPLDLTVAREELLRWSFGHPFLDEVDLNGRPAVWMVLAGLALGAAGLAIRGVSRPSSRTALILALAAAVPVGAALYSVIGDSVYTPRNLIPSWPGLALAAGALLMSGRGWIPAAATALCVGGLAIGSVRVQDPDSRRPSYENAAEFIEEAAPKGAPIVQFTPVVWGPQTPLEAALGPPHEYRPGGHPVLVVSASGGQGLPSLAQRHRYLHAGATILSYAQLTRGRTTPEQVERAARFAHGGPIVFVGQEKVRSGFALVDGAPPEEFLRELPAGYRLVEERSFPGFAHHGLGVYVFSRVGS